MFCSVYSIGRLEFKKKYLEDNSTIDLFIGNCLSAGETGELLYKKKYIQKFVQKNKC